MNWFSKTMAIGLGFAGAIVTSPAKAATCVPLPVLNSTETEISKTISRPRLLGGNNWNTDFVIPSQATFAWFVAVIYAENSGNYSVQMNLKYEGGSSDRVFADKVQLAQAQAFNIPATPRFSAIPSQVNLVVGESTDSRYRASVFGCNPSAAPTSTNPVPGTDR